jgi:hypothetical protein
LAAGRPGAGEGVIAVRGVKREVGDFYLPIVIEISANLGLARTILNFMKKISLDSQIVGRARSCSDLPVAIHVCDQAGELDPMTGVRRTVLPLESIQNNTEPGIGVRCAKKFSMPHFEIIA